ncbi:Vascular endothelial growth factor receptor 1 [Pseudolycoriella hygida]|uniref:Vascular endothelial growth factor receptor 1 n=1 Tax=Pseudolycoriella hygida TaxID=35572 RepID=A0A9Q0MIY6_9DIPT|nr:Vascular endothelial growth factor receptor 1 [Pseudolycoriella hygida]
MQVATNSAGSETYLLPQNSKGSSSSTAPVCSNDSVTLSNNSSQSQSAFYKVPTRYFTTTDLLCWSFQVARGMTYLSSRKVLHGDLAARNILLCNDNVVKICDFGLARSLYKCNNYKKEGGTPLPLKWLALESISDQTFSTLSDVWSFGILMWELFSLGTTPYPGMEANQEFFYKLRKGYRMEKPESATKEVYDLMLQCWSRDPESRPLFNILEEKLRKVMDNEVAQYYVNLNEQYVQINAYNARQGEFDYITIMGGPAPEGYLPMKPIIRNNESAAGTSGRAVSNIGYFIPKE